MTAARSCGTSSPKCRWAHGSEPGRLSFFARCELAVTNAEDREHAVKAVAAFEKTYGAKRPTAVKKIANDVD